jgi:hypothetical protein
MTVKKNKSCREKAVIIAIFIFISICMLVIERDYLNQLLTGVAPDSVSSNVVSDGKEMDMGEDVDMTTDDMTTDEFKGFNQTNPFDHSWCPHATCFNSPICSPCNRRFLFIIATGRSGSTTLLKMFNQLPNVRLSGENYNALFQASRIPNIFEKNPKHFINKKVMKNEQFMHGAVKDGPFSHNAIPMGSMSCVMQHLVSTLNPPPLTNETQSYDIVEEANKILGMKVIRLQNSPWTPKETARFFQENFPCSRIILNIRSNAENQVNSFAYAFKRRNITKEESMEITENIEKQNVFLKRLHAFLGNEIAHLIDMTEWKEDVEILNEVVKWLGFDQCSFNTLLHENFDGYGHDNETKIDLGKDCGKDLI